MQRNRVILRKVTTRHAVQRFSNIGASSSPFLRWSCQKKRCPGAACQVARQMNQAPAQGMCHGLMQLAEAHNAEAVGDVLV